MGTGGLGVGAGVGCGLAATAPPADGDGRFAVEDAEVVQATRAMSAPIAAACRDLDFTISG